MKIKNNVTEINITSKKIKAKWIIAVLSTIFLVAFIIYRINIYNSSVPVVQYKNNFTKSLSTFLKSDQRSIFLRDLTDFEWVRACVFGSYQTELGGGIFRWMGDDCCLLSDGAWGIQFVDKKNRYKPICIEGAFLKKPKLEQNCFLYNDAILIKNNGLHDVSIMIRGTRQNNYKGEKQ